MLEEMTGNAEAFYQALNIPYRIVGIVSGKIRGNVCNISVVEAFPK